MSQDPTGVPGDAAEPSSGGRAKKATGKKTTGKKAAAKKAAAKKTAKQATAKKATAKKATAKKATAKKATAKKATAKKATAKRATGKRTTQPPAQQETDDIAAEPMPETGGPPSPDRPRRLTSAAVSVRLAAREAEEAAERARLEAAQDRAAEPPAEPTLDPASVSRRWLQSYPPGVPATYDYPEVPLTRLLDDAAKDFPDGIAIEFLGRTITYRKLADEVDRFATALRGLGVSKGDRVGLILPNCPQHVIALFAALRVGAIVAETNPLYTERELEHQINDAGCRVLVLFDPVYAKIANLKGRLRTVEHVIGTGLHDYLPAPKNVLFPLKYRKDPGVYYKIPSGEGVMRFTDLVAKTPPTAAQEPLDPRADLAMLLYTGGTTGLSKGVMLTHHNLVANAFQGRLWMPDIQAGRENVLCVMPFFHSYGLTTCLTLGMLSAATLTLLPKFERDTVLRTIDKQRPTLFPGVPTIYVALNNAPNVRKFDLSSIRACLSGAAPLPVEVAKTFEELTGGKLREGYGLTETSPITHANPIYGKAKKGRIGLPVTDTLCVLVDLSDPTRPAPPNEPGELAIRGPQVMQGYWNRPEETAAAFSEGWLLTGDIATVDEDGYFAVIDRKKDMIIAGGLNIYPRDIEEVLYTHPAVEKAVAVGLPDEYRGETVKAYVVPKQGQNIAIDELDAYLRERLAAYKVPTAYELRSELPETMVGKILRRRLVEEHLAKK